MKTFVCGPIEGGKALIKDIKYKTGAKIKETSVKEIRKYDRLYRGLVKRKRRDQLYVPLKNPSGQKKGKQEKGCGFVVGKKAQH